MAKKKEELYTKTRIKREFGWTDKCIRYLPQPNGKVRSWYGVFPGWTKDLILETQQKPEVQKILEDKKKHQKARQIGAEKALETKRKKTVQDIEKINVSVWGGYKRQELVKMAIDSHKEFLRNRHRPDDNFTVGDREIVNFIRHELTSYDYDLGELYQRVGRSTGYDIITEKVYEAIEKAYPEYSKECEKQMLEHFDRY